MLKKQKQIPTQVKQIRSLMKRCQIGTIFGALSPQTDENTRPPQKQRILIKTLSRTPINNYGQNNEAGTDDIQVMGHWTSF